jgi:hypothetical protein
MNGGRTPLGLGGPDVEVRNTNGKMQLRRRGRLVRNLIRSDPFVLFFLDAWPRWGEALSFSKLLLLAGPAQTSGSAEILSGVQRALIDIPGYRRLSFFS